eukprot:g875.t1
MDTIDVRHFCSADHVASTSGAHDDGDYYFCIDSGAEDGLCPDAAVDFVRDGRTCRFRGVTGGTAVGQRGAITPALVDVDGRRRVISFPGFVSSRATDEYLMPIAAYHEEWDIDFRGLRASIGGFSFPLELRKNPANGRRSYVLRASRASADERVDHYVRHDSCPPPCHGSADERMRAEHSLVSDDGAPIDATPANATAPAPDAEASPGVSASQTKAGRFLLGNARLDMVHRRAGHINKRYAAKLLAADDDHAKTDGLPLLRVPKCPCPVCAQAVMSRTDISRECSERPSAKNTALVGDWVDFDVEQADGSVGFVLLADKASVKPYAELGHSKSEIPSLIKDICLTNGIPMSGLRIRFDYDSTLHPTSDGGLHLRRLGINFEHSSPYDQSQNGDAERFVRTIKARMKALLFERNAPERAMCYALRHAVFIHANCPLPSLGGKTPNEVHGCRQWNVARTPVLFSGSWVYVPRERRSQSQGVCEMATRHATPMIFVGVCPEHGDGTLQFVPSFDVHPTTHSRLQRSYSIDERRYDVNAWLKAARVSAGATPVMPALPPCLYAGSDGGDADVGDDARGGSTSDGDATVLPQGAGTTDSVGSRTAARRRKARDQTRRVRFADEATNDGAARTVDDKGDETDKKTEDTVDDDETDKKTEDDDYGSDSTLDLGSDTDDDDTIDETVRPGTTDRARACAAREDHDIPGLFWTKLPADANVRKMAKLFVVGEPQMQRWIRCFKPFSAGGKWQIDGPTRPVLKRGTEVPHPVLSGFLWDRVQDCLSLDDAVSLINSEGRSDVRAIRIRAAKSHKKFKQLNRGDPLLKDPKNREEATRSPFARHWRDGELEELKELQGHKTYDTVPTTEVPDGKKPIGCRWVYKIKWNLDGTVKRFKVRLVAQGFSQKAGEDFMFALAPSLLLQHLRLVLARAARLKHALQIIDWSNAYVQSDLDCEIFMRMPPGYEEHGYVLKLNKSLYGLRQAGRLWAEKLRVCIQKLGFVRSNVDFSVYHRKSDNVTVAIYTDDATIDAPTHDIINAFKEEIKKSECPQFSESPVVSELLGMEITQHEDMSIEIRQTTYIKNVLEEHGFSDIRACVTPAIKSCRAQDDVSPTNKPFSPAHPTAGSWQRLKRVCGFLKGTAEQSITYRAGDQWTEAQRLIVFCDSDFAFDPTRRSCVRMAKNPTSIRNRHLDVPDCLTKACGSDVIAASLPILTGVGKCPSLKNIYE